ncbi:MAG TPA: hypothetical protein VFE37_26465 [Chloroflexota bacterium]|nr:hypothetical protein [Chloroflexota bacterium]
MVRRLAIGTIAAAALFGGAFAATAQAQVANCDSWNRGGACGEIRFNASPDPSDAAPQIQIAGQAQMPPAAAQASSATTSQAAPQAEAQPAGEE